MTADDVWECGCGPGEGCRGKPVLVPAADAVIYGVVRCWDWLDRGWRRLCGFMR